MEQLDYNLLYRWFVGLGVDEPVWVATVFTKNRDRLLEALDGRALAGHAGGVYAAFRGDLVGYLNPDRQG